MRSVESPAIPDICAMTDALFADAIQQRVSDIHIEPTADGCDVRVRIDGVLQLHRRLDSAIGRSLATRAMVLAKLLTYRLDVPQEGRASIDVQSRAIDLRVSMIPTTHGPRVAIRLPGDLAGDLSGDLSNHLHAPSSIDALSLPSGVTHGLHKFARAESGLLMIVGPAGSGKTTTAYALLQTIVETSPGLSVVSLEDPVERDLAGVTQIEITPFGERTYERCLRSILRQDPQVLMLGEIRDAATASLAVQAALSGHRLICTLNAGNAGGAVARLIEMGIEPYQLTSTLAGIVTQRLIRRSTAEGGYRGRVPIATFSIIDRDIRAALLRRADRDELESIFAQQSAFTSLESCGAQLMASGVTDAAELCRLGLLR